MEQLPVKIKNYFPDEILYNIYKYVDEKKDYIIANRLYEINNFLDTLLFEELYIRTNTNYDIHEMMEIFIKKNKNIELFKDSFNMLKYCNCCQRHKHNVPKHIYDYWDTQDFSPYRKDNILCGCRCRHLRRILCSVI